MGYDSDIEDLEVDISTRQPANANIININRKSSYNSDCTVSQQPYLPGAQKVWLKTFGCSHNVLFAPIIINFSGPYKYLLSNALGFR
jgi:hypothetical protein